MTQLISRREIQSRIEKGDHVQLVEALPERFYAEAHLPGALQINHDEIDDKAPKLLTNKETMIIVYCSNTACANSAKAATRLEQLGYINVHKYAEGKEDWVNAGLPVEKAA